MKPIARMLFVAVGALFAASCSKQIEAPGDTGVCWHMAPLPNGKVRFNKVSTNEPSIERCAGSLDGMRLRFMALGGPEEITGAYQGNFLFLNAQGIYMSQSITGIRYLLMVRTGDGRLVRPSEIPQ